MMTYYEVYPADNRVNVWVLGYDDADTGHNLFNEYVDLICPNCGKVDERAAIERFIHPAVRVTSKSDSKRDLIGTEDGFLLVSRRFEELMARQAIRGLQMTPLPGDDRFFLAVPIRVPTDFDRAGLEIHGPDGGTPYRTPGERLETPDHRCIVCGRHYELCLQPMLRAMELPSDPLTLFTSEVRFEKQYGEMTLLFASEHARAILDESGLKGLDFVEAY